MEGSSSSSSGKRSFFEEGSSSSSSGKRSFFEDDDDSNKNKGTRIRFPKGKKVKSGPDPDASKEKDNPLPQDFSNPQAAAKERAKCRTQTVLAEDDDVELSRISEVEVRYEVNEPFVEDGIQMEPFNLEREREEGYFDEAGNFVEFVTDKEAKDPWLDSIQFDPKHAEIFPTVTKHDHEGQDFPSDGIQKIKRRIANALKPGETVRKALRRLKGNSTDRRAKMSTETRREFDRLTEDTMKLVDSGDYDVYDKAQEAFEREARGHEASEENRTSVPRVDSGSSWDGQSDYVYDEASGYYYSSSLGYYYDPPTGLFYSAVSGQWYK